MQTYTRDVGELALSPDGKKVAFTVRGKIFADFADKETERDQRQGPAYRVSQTAFRDSDIAWSPDSRCLVYVSDRHGDEEVYRYDFPTRCETRLTCEPKRKSAPCFSPDGRWIAYASGSDEIRLIDVASGEDRPFIRAHFVFGASFAWSPRQSLAGVLRPGRTLLQQSVCATHRRSTGASDFVPEQFAGGRTTLVARWTFLLSLRPVSTAQSHRLRASICNRSRRCFVR